jgi:SAM-dependent methyltransferase
MSVDRAVPHARTEACEASLSTSKPRIIAVNVSRRIARMALAGQANLMNGMLFFQKNRQCPLCGWSGFTFLPTGPGPYFRFDVLCPRCASWERHRLAYMLLKDALPKRLGKVLHIAPEKSIQAWVAGLSDDYHTADLQDAKAMHKVDIQAMPFAAESFDCVWCSHVLEHVPDDRKAIAEIKRILKVGGIAVIQVPVWGGETEETVLSTDHERLMRYFQADHVRRYGSDILGRLEESGLSVAARSIREIELHVVIRHGLNDPAGDDVFVATRLPA